MKHLRLVGLMVLLLLQGSRASAAGPQKVDPLELQADPQLQAKLSMDLVRPRVEDVLEQLRKATGLNLTLGKGVDQDEPAFGSLVLRNVPAWKVMQQLPQSIAVEGHWEKVEGGYRLVGTRGGEEVSPKRGGVVLWLVAGSLIVLLAISGWFLVRHFQQRSKKSPAST